VTKASGNIVLNNTISGTGQAAIAFVRSGSTSTRSSNNQVHSNTIRYAGDFGIYMAVGSDNSILNNKVFSNASGIKLEDQNATIGNRLTVRNNDVYSNSGFGLYITDTAGLDLGENLILDNSLGVLWDLNNIPGTTVISRNVICRNPIYLFRNNDTAASVTAARNWWGKNNPAIGTEIQGPVIITPNMVLSATATPSTLPATGVSTTTLTVSLQGGGETVPLRARTIALTTTLGAISPTVVTLNNSGVATTTYTSANTSGVAVITATDLCAFQVTSKVDPIVKTRKPKFKVPFTPCVFNISLIR
jgi:parallel beta-helix repeat protein